MAPAGGVRERADHQPVADEPRPPGRGRRPGGGLRPRRAFQVGQLGPPGGDGAFQAGQFGPPGVEGAVEPSQLGLPHRQDPAAVRQPGGAVLELTVQGGRLSPRRLEPGVHLPQGPFGIRPLVAGSPGGLLVLPDGRLMPGLGGRRLSREGELAQGGREPVRSLRGGPSPAVRAPSPAGARRRRPGPRRSRARRARAAPGAIRAGPRPTRRPRPRGGSRRPVRRRTRPTTGGARRAGSTGKPTAARSPQAAGCRTRDRSRPRRGPRPRSGPRDTAGSERQTWRSPHSPPAGAARAAAPRTFEALIGPRGARAIVRGGEVAWRAGRGTVSSVCRPRRLLQQTRRMTGRSSDAGACF